MSSQNYVKTNSVEKPTFHKSHSEHPNNLQEQQTIHNHLDQYLC